MESTGKITQLLSFFFNKQQITSYRGHCWGHEPNFLPPNSGRDQENEKILSIVTREHFQMAIAYASAEEDILRVWQGAGKCESSTPCAMFLSLTQETGEFRILGNVCWI